MYKIRVYGCTIFDDEKKKAHLTKVSKYCRFNGKSKDFIASEREEYLSSIAISEMGEIGKLMIIFLENIAPFDEYLLY